MWISQEAIDIINGNSSIDPTSSTVNLSNLTTKESKSISKVNILPLDNKNDVDIKKVGENIRKASKEVGENIRKASQENKIDALKTLLSDWKGNEIINELEKLLSFRYLATAYNALHYSIKNKYIDCVELLICNGCDIEFCDSKGHTPIDLAVQGGNEKIISLLICNGCKRKLKNQVTNKTIKLLLENPIYYFVQKGQQINLEMYLSNNVVHTIESIEGVSALHLASQSGYDGCLSILISYFPLCINSQSGDKGKTPAHYAVENNHLKCLEALCSSKDIDLFKVDDNKYNILHYSSKFASDSCLEFLIQLKNVKITNDLINGAATIMHLSINSLSSSLKCLELILSNNMELINSIDIEGNSLLHLACKLNLEHHVAYLIKNKIDRTIMNKKGLKAIDLCSDLSNIWYIVASDEERIKKMEIEENIQYEKRLAENNTINRKGLVERILFRLSINIYLYY